ncbi:hypothetical protein BTE77_18645 [Ensifer adhaerens]|nr:hypothetical protein BTE77_18645 [Ensifer adhaerens]
MLRSEVSTGKIAGSLLALTRAGDAVALQKDEPKRSAAGAGFYILPARSKQRGKGKHAGH